MFSTPAIASKEVSIGAGEAASSNSPPATFANHGCEAFLVRPHVDAIGYHQGEDAVGFRSIIIRLQRTSVHRVLVYFDASVGLDGGSNVEKAKDVLRIISAVKLPWLILGLSLVWLCVGMA